VFFGVSVLHEDSSALVEVTDKGVNNFHSFNIIILLLFFEQFTENPVNYLFKLFLFMGIEKDYFMKK
jgi:hypothetical protein